MPTDFEVMAAIAKRDGKIASVGLGNMISLQSCKQGYQVTLGIDRAWGEKIARGECVGAFYLIDAKEFAEEKAKGGAA